MEQKYFLIFAILFVVIFLGGLNLQRYMADKKDIEYARAGLQQCLESDKILWKKECK